MNGGEVSLYVLPRRALQVIAVAAVVSIAALAIAVGAVVHLTNERALYDPLAEVPVQRVDSRIPGMDSPAAYLDGGIVTVTGTKCAKAETRIRGSFSWVAIDPPGASVPVGGGRNVRLKGCTTRTFENAIPTEVVARAERLARQGVTRTVWQLVGEEVPIDQQGREGVPVQWQSQNFTIVAE